MSDRAEPNGDGRRPRRWRRPGLGLVLGALIAVAAGACVQLTGALAGLERDSLGARFAIRHAAPPAGVAIVGIDDATFAALQRQWPFPRSLHGELIRRLKAAGARQVIYDVQFTEPSQPAQDMALYRAIGDAGNVLLATTQMDHGHTDVLGGDANLAAAHARAGSSNLPVDGSGAISHFPYSVGGLPSLAVLAAARAGHPVPRDAFGSDGAWIDYRGGAGTFPTLSFADVLRGRFDPGAVRGRIVLVGATTPSLQDFHETPTATSRPMAGVEVQANAVWTALHGVPLRDPPAALTVLALLLMGLIVPLARLRTRIVPAALVAPVAALAYAMAAEVAFSGGIVVPVVAPAVALLTGVVAMVVSSHVGESVERSRVSRHAAELERLVRERTEALEESQLEVIRRLGQAAESRDEETGQHIERISRLVHRLALAIGMDPEQAELLRYASAMHDVGKIGIPDRILLKPAKLDEDEFAVMRTHTTIGATLLGGSPSPLLQMAEVIARTHHERWDGRGYPLGLAGEDIPVVGRIVAICDVFDALVSRRPYKEPWSVEDALAEIRDQRERHFDPAIVDAFLALAPTGPDTVLAPVVSLRRPLAERPEDELEVRSA